MDAFYSSNKSRCKECVRTAARIYRADHLEEVRAYDRQRGDLPHRKEAVRSRAHRYAGKHQADFAENHPEKRAAHIIVGNAIRDGKLIVQPSA